MSDEEKRGPGRPPKVAPVELAEPTVKAVVMRDYWTKADEAGRVRTGTVLDVSKDDLIAGLETGILARHVEK